MADDDSADAICRRMAELRRELSCDVQEVGREVGRTARVMTDWTFYVRRFPWAVAALALGAGYLLVPRRKEVIKPDPAQIEEMVRRKQIRVETKEQHKQDQGLMKSLLAMGITWAAKTGASYLGERMRTAAMHKAHSDEQAAPFQPETIRSGDGNARQPR